MSSELAVIPVEVEKLILCPVCGGRRRRIADGGWLCVQPGHTGVFYDGSLLDRIDRALPREKDEVHRRGATDREIEVVSKRRLSRVKAVLKQLKDLAKKES